jgi:hypothetical protein
MKTLVAYLAQRPDTSTFLVPADLERTMKELFTDPERLLPQPYKIFLADETVLPSYGYPVAESAVMKELDARLERWLGEEIACQINRAASKEKAQATWASYLQQLLKLAENALMSNLLGDYHGIFWLAHSFDLARQFSAIPRRISALDTQTGRALGDTLKYRIFARWVSETREQMTQLAARAARLCSTVKSNAASSSSASCRTMCCC